MLDAAENQRLPSELNSPYLVEWGEDDYGIYQILELFGVEHVFRWIPPGTFQMGSPENEKGRIGEREVQHWVTLSQGFWLGKCTVTQAQWMAAKITSENPSQFKGDDYPVESVSWEDCQQFINSLVKHYPELRARLPTEAEWEYACRAGTTSPFYWGEEVGLDRANYRGTWEVDVKKLDEYHPSALKKTCAVKQYQPNPWGLYQMHGNVWEWCNDWYEEQYPQGKITDPEGPLELKDKGSAGRVLRGGSWDDRGRYLRSACRFRYRPGDRDDDTGFRLALGRELQSGGAANSQE